MKPSGNQPLKWELARERFQIEDRFPPKELRPEKRIGDILTGILKTENTETEANALPVAISERWPVIAGEQLAKHVQPVCLKDGFLYLQADHPGWLTESRRLPRTQLLKKIASIPGIPEIKDIRFQLDPALKTRNRK